MNLGWGLTTNSLEIIRKLIVLLKRILLSKNFKTIFFYPEFPCYRDVIYKICFINGHKMVRKPGNTIDLVIHWDENTFWKEHQQIEKCKDSIPKINNDCKNISKPLIDKYFQEIFGYSIQIDPTKFLGKCVRKNVLNAKHDGKIINCPVKEADKKYVYQHIINNSLDGKIVEDVRVPIFKNSIPFVYLKYRPIDDRFSNTNDKVLISKTEDILSNNEIDKIHHFCRKINLNYGELDIIRNYPKGTLYIIDVNNCPSGPPNHLGLFKSIKALLKLSKQFNDVFLFDKLYLKNQGKKL